MLQFPTEQCHIGLPFDAAVRQRFQLQLRLNRSRSQARGCFIGLRSADEVRGSRLALFGRGCLQF